MDIKELLPIGTVIVTKGAEKRLMIIGIMPVDVETGDSYDYLAVLYPEGYINVETMYFVEHKDIENIIYYGMDDEERIEFLTKIEEFYE